MRRKRDGIMEEKDLDNKLKKALKDIKDGLLFSEDDGDDKWEPIEYSSAKGSIFEQKLKEK